MFFKNILEMKVKKKIHWLVQKGISFLSKQTGISTIYTDNALSLLVEFVNFSNENTIQHDIAKLTLLYRASQIGYNTFMKQRQ